MQDDKSDEQEVVLPLLELREQLPKVIADTAVFEEAVNRIANKPMRRAAGRGG